MQEKWKTSQVLKTMILIMLPVCIIITIASAVVIGYVQSNIEIRENKPYVETYDFSNIYSMSVYSALGSVGITGKEEEIEYQSTNDVGIVLESETFQKKAINYVSWYAPYLAKGRIYVCYC